MPRLNKRSKLVKRTYKLTVVGLVPDNWGEQRIDGSFEIYVRKVDPNVRKWTITAQSISDDGPVGPVEFGHADL